MSKTLNTPLWTRRSPEETRALYRDWAATYDADIKGAGYATPARLAAALDAAVADKATPVLDFGCGTGLSGLALSARGFTVIDGTDITPEMLDKAAATGAYRRTWLSEPAAAPGGSYGAIVAAGVVSLGAAPPETLALLLDAVAPGGLVAFSYNDATLAEADYMVALDAAKARSETIHHSYGDHLPGKDMKSAIYILRRS
jgi:predicted TPR repeat methyltransferase